MITDPTDRQRKPTWFHRQRGITLAAVAIVSWFAPSSLTGQCTSDIRTEVLALDKVVETILKHAGAGQPTADSISRANFVAATNGHGGSSATSGFSAARARAAIDDRGIYLSALVNAGPALPCLAAQWDVFHATAKRLTANFNELTPEQLQAALREASAAVLATRFAPTDRGGRALRDRLQRSDELQPARASESHRAGD